MSDPVGFDHERISRAANALADLADQIASLTTDMVDPERYEVSGQPSDRTANKFRADLPKMRVVKTTEGDAVDIEQVLIDAPGEVRELGTVVGDAAKVARETGDRIRDEADTLRRNVTTN